MHRITVVGGGFAGLTAAVSAAEAGAEVTLYEAHHTLGGRARTADAPYRTNEGPRTPATAADPTGPGCARGACSARSPRCLCGRRPGCGCVTGAPCAAPRRPRC